jgi:hypothetical protein
MGNILRKIVRKQKAFQLEIDDEGLKYKYLIQGIPYESIRDRRNNKRLIDTINQIKQWQS